MSLLSGSNLDSPFQVDDLTNLFISNDVPSLQQEEILRALVASLRAEILSIDQEIAGRKLRRQNLARAMSQHSPLLSALRRFPAEILSEVFVHCLPEQGTVTSYRDAPLKLCAVSAKWRQVARSTPALWTHLSLQWPDSEGKNTDLAYLWLCQSRPLPLSLSVTLHDDVGEDAALLIKRLQADIHRWTSKTEREDANEQPEVVAPPSPGLLLEKIACEIQLSDQDPWFNSGWPCAIFSWASSLKCLIWNGPCARLSEMSFTGLTTLYLNQSAFPDGYGLPGLNFLTILSQTPALKCCKVHLHSVDNFGFAPPNGLHVSLPQLQLLWIVVHEFAYHDLEPLFDSLTLSSLTILTAELSGGEYVDDDAQTWPFASFTDLLSRSACSLASLAIDGLCMRRQEFELIACLRNEILRYTLMVLDLESSRGISMVSQIMLQTLQSPEFLPKLQSLALPVFPKASCLIKDLVSLRTGVLKEVTLITLSDEVRVPDGAAWHMDAAIKAGKSFGTKITNTIRVPVSSGMVNGRQ